ncbi:MAG: hypothetical protein DMF63_14660 [Acidobacteria bacterium]|nr:MAG: hypothetical protein DMF63_14660 [Acidobacteriota bacterium]
MKRVLFAFIFCVFGLASAFAQTATPTPTPAPTPAPAATPVVDDTQNVAPDKLQGVPAIAPNYSSDDRTLPDLGRVGVDMTDQRSLTLNEAITAEFDLLASRGVYEPRFRGQTYYERATVPNISFFSPETDSVTSKSIAGNVGLVGYVPKFGTVLDATFKTAQVGTDNLVQIISPQYNSDFTFSLTQPLLRGRRFDQNRRVIEIAKRNLSLTDVQFRQRSIEIIASVQRAYWDLTYALRNLQVQRDGVRDAKDQLAHNRRLVEEGQLAPIDIVAAETQVANFEQSVYEGLNTVTVAENALKNLIAPTRTDVLWSESVTPVDSVDLDAPTTSLSEALDAALLNRPELEINQAQKDINSIDQRYFKEAKKPQIDLIASYTSSGVGGTLNPNFRNPFCANNPNPQQCAITAGPALQTLIDNVGGPATTITDIFQNKYPTLRVGVQFNLPVFGDKTSKAQYGRSLVEGERLDVQREQLEQNIQVDVRNALQTLRTAEARLRAAAISRENSVKQYESEQRKLDNGQSDIYRVLERQTALTTARSNELKAQTELNKAISDLQRATGNSLKANNVVSLLK